METATESHSVSFRQIHLEDSGRIRYRKVCELDGQELTEAEIGKGYEISKDQLVPITDADLAGMPLPTAKAIEIVAFVPWESIDPRHIGEASYYIRADGQVAAKPYTLLRQALGRNSKVAVAKFALRGRERLGLVRPIEDALVLHSMRWDDEVRDPSELAPGTVDVSDHEIDGAVALMEAMSVGSLADLAPAEITDQYTEALHKVIEAKAEGHRPAMPTTEAEPAGQVVDLMAALEQSVAKAKEARGETGGGDATVHEMPAPKKKATAKKPAAKKAPAKKTAAKKTTAKKTTRKRAS
ncbi:non-homologous end joining protein Ku [Streptomyces sp. NPDC054975]